MSNSTENIVSKSSFSQNDKQNEDGKKAFSDVKMLNRIANAYLNILTTDSQIEINYNDQFKKCNIVLVEYLFEKIILKIFQLATIEPTECLSILDNICESIRLRFQSEHKIDVKLSVNLSELKLSLINLSKNKEAAELKIKKPIKNQTLFRLVDFLRGYKASLILSELIRLNLFFRHLDVTREISDCSCFLVDGYSLILECFHQNKIDWSLGGQYLHLVYLIENYIKTLSNLSEFYYIVFFNDLNSSFLDQTQLYLAISVIFNHLTLEPFRDKIKYFKSVSSDSYEEFIRTEKPTFLVLSDKFETAKSKPIYTILKLYHMRLEMNLMLIHDLAIKSNRLNAFYFRNRNSTESNTWFQLLNNLNYQQDLTSQIKESESFFIDRNRFLAKLAQNKLKILSKKISSKLTFYSISLVWCYKQKMLSDNLFGIVLFNLIIHSYLQNELNLEYRALRLMSSNNLEIKSFLESFLSFLAYSIQSNDLSSLKLKPNELCDIFDGRLFSFCLLVSKCAELRRAFEITVFQTHRETINEMLIYLRNELNETSFSSLIDLGSLDASSDELFRLFESFFNSESHLKEHQIEDLCFKKRDDETNSAEMVISSHPLHVELLEEIDLAQSSLNFRVEFEKTVNEFKTKHNWNDSFNPYSYKVKNDIDCDEKLEEIIKNLNLYSFDYSTSKSEMSEQQLEEIKETIKDSNFDEALEMTKSFNETTQTIYKILLWFLDKHKANRIKNKSKTKLEKFGVLILIKAAQLWKKILNNEFQDLNERQKLIKLILNILDYFNFSKTFESVLGFVSKKNWLQKNEFIPEENALKFEMSESEYRFQMKYLSDYLERETRSERVHDKRTSLFTPDKWQIDFLNAIDANQSILITAPTSSGKTYASFYAMEKLLLDKKDEDSVLVYVSPTKALVNQTAFAILKRFQHIKLNDNKKLCGVFTRDFRNNLLDCRILVTVPQCLFILAINIAHSRWLKNVKYVVLDEIHSMSGESNADVWEHLLLLINCPFIALSATIANTKSIHQWLNKLVKNKSSKNSVRLIEYRENFTDLKRFIYTNIGLKAIHPFGLLNLKSVKKHNNLPTDLKLSAKEILQMYDCLKEIYTKDEDLECFDTENCRFLYSKPEESLFLTKNLIKEYDTQLRGNFETRILSETKTKKLNQLIEFFEPKFDENELYPAFKTSAIDKKEKQEHRKYFLRLIQDLSEENMLPCIVFTNNRIICEEYCKLIAESDIDLLEADLNNNTEDMIQPVISSNTYLTEISKVIDKGVAYHHSGLLPHEKSLVEACFRLGKIKIIIATATLALGVHMPCKTVVFMDDDIYLDSFQYRQAAGRAGRRGYETIGNVIFFDIPYSKVKRLVSSYLPDIRPHFPLSQTFSLQLFDLAFKSERKFNLSVDCVLNKSFWNFKNSSKLSQVHYHAVFGLNFLMDLQLLNSSGKFSMFTKMIERIGYHEPANFALYHLFINGVFHELVNIDSDDDLLASTIVMNVICHLFNPQPKRNKGFNLPDLPSYVLDNIKSYNNFVLKSFTSFFISLCKKLKETTKKDINVLPLSGISFSKETSSYWVNFMTKWIYKYSLASPFAALSGILDENVLDVSNELYLNCLSLIHIDSKILPLMNVPGSDCLSNYALYFYNSDAPLADVVSKLLESGICFGDLINLLKDFKLTLASIKFCLKDISPDNDKVFKIFELISNRFKLKFESLINNLSEIYEII